MTKSWNNCCWKFALVSALETGRAITLTGWFALGFASALWAIATSEISAFAQVTADPSLGTVVTPNGTTFQITGGRTVGNTNLFHSFSNFSIPNGAIANFWNAGAIANIFARVTGGSPSNIQGLIHARGNANLFLINPNGILFGQNARLNIGGSFVGTTANAIAFPGGAEFSLTSTVSPDNSLLAVNPSALLFNQIAAQPTHSIEVRGNLAVDKNRSLLLVGGNVSPTATSTGGVLIDDGRLQAPGGRIELGGIGGTGTVGLNVDGSNWRLSFPPGVARTDVSLRNEANVNVSADRGGSIGVNARNLNMAGASRLQAGIAPGLGSANSQAGDIDVNATEKITLTHGSSIDNSVQFRAKGRSGNVFITADTILFDGQSSVFRASGTYSRILEGATGQGGNIDIKARSLQLINGAYITTSTRGVGNAGHVTIIADTVSFDGQGDFQPKLGARSSTAAFSAVTGNGTGQGGSVNITARSLSLTNGGAIITSTLGQGNAGSITINADIISFDGEGSDFSNDFNSSGAYSSVLSGAVGQGGRIDITARLLSLTNGAVITTATWGQGDAGRVVIHQADKVFLDGQSQRGSRSRLLAETLGFRDAGDLTINTRQLVVQKGAQVSARTSNAGRAGTLLVNATDSVTVDGQGSTLDFDSRSQSRNGGDAGDLRIFTRQLLVQNGAKVSARTSGAGNAGTLEVKAESVTVDGSGSGLTFDTRGTGNARGIRIETGQLVVQNGGQITVSGTSSGNPGDLEIIAGSIFLSGNGRLTTETASGEGGNIRLRVQDEILMRYNSLISASAKGSGNGGNVEIEIPNGFILAVLPENSDIIASAKQGNGGVARATAGGVFGFRQFIDRDTPESDFTASSVLGIDGTREIITPNRRLEELPGNVTNAEIAQGCAAVRGQEPNRFVVTGRGGLPPNPKEPLSKDAVQVDWVTLNPEGENRSSSAVAAPETSATPGPLVEAQGWVMNDKGQVVLTASVPKVTPHSPWQTPTNCSTARSTPAS